MSYGKENPYDELARRNQARAKAKALYVEQQHKQTDELLTHTAQVPEGRRMPPELPAIRAWWLRLFRWASKTPRHLELMAFCIGEIWYVEGIMSRWLVIPDILDEDQETEFKAMLKRYSGMGIDYSGFMEGGESEPIPA